MAKVSASTRAPSNPVAKPGLVTKLARRKNKKKKFWKSNARGASANPGSAAGVAVRPPQAPEEFSRNWKALRELLKQKSQAPEKPLDTSQMGSKKQPEIIQRNRKEISDKARRDEMSTEKDQEATGGPIPAGFKVGRKVPVPPMKASGTEHSEKGTRKRTNGDISQKRGDIKHKKRKAEEKAASAPAPPTEDDIWFDDVDPVDIEAALGPEAAKLARKQLGQSDSGITLVKEQGFGGLTKALAMDCEMVGVGPQGQESVAARVSLVNQYGRCVYDKYVKPTEPVTDYRTAVSGILPEHLTQGEEFGVVQKEVAEMLKGRVLVLFLDHPKKKIRDTQKYKPFKSRVQSGRPSLKLLSEKILGIRVQQAEHCSVQDAQAAMRLYVMVKKEWESMAGDRRPLAAAPDSHTDDA
ncbi:PREDICTED: RNA exonuclease 4 isoform X2 [Propithecus coquereli]|uniref:RNA exonuclease 4 isoform X2 n=1 Tax=Propithecus coquereli TaxID=379532 RepID=UPI00063FBFC6|nr:PREDICTED: RNA exonuclease 4 isoform X2 [Propithecus coquereli]